jgi:hypothetical protein
LVANLPLILIIVAQLIAPRRLVASNDLAHDVIGWLVLRPAHPANQQLVHVGDQLRSLLDRHVVLAGRPIALGKLQQLPDDRRLSGCFAVLLKEVQPSCRNICASVLFQKFVHCFIPLLCFLANECWRGSAGCSGT